MKRYKVTLLEHERQERAAITRKGSHHSQKLSVAWGIDTIEQLREEVSAWQARRDQLQARVNSQFTAQDQRIKLKRLYPRFDA